MDKKILIIIVILIAILFYFVTKSKFNDDILKTNYDNNGTNVPSCNFKNENRVYPSGNVPGSYLSLNDHEKEMLLTRFIDYSNSPNSTEAPIS